MKISQFVTTSVLVLSLILAGCGKTETVNKSDDKKNQDTVTVYTTIYPLEDFTKKIGGEFVDVQSIYPPNVDAHTFEPSQKDMVSLANSDLFIYTGVGLEGFADKAAEALKKEDVQIVKAADGIELLETEDEHHHGEGESESEQHEDENGHSEEDTHKDSEAHEDHADGDLDPHVWLDPVLSIDLAKNIKNALSKQMPERTAEFESNFNQLKDELEKLDQEFKTTIESSKTRNILVAHAAYGYWEKRYGIEEIAISGLSPTQEPSQKELQAIIEESAEHNIHYVIFEQNVSPKIAKIIQEEIGAKSLTLHNLEAITEENIKQKDDYFSIMRKNLETIKTVLNN
ncbi:zinc ABC transporter substrate-binding protein [Bacillus sp. EB106-08-02-XG196]|uniref:metal ABC transporter solute-binding protein, Zn/Mn family n=1 Tax=Bacillus sp. EB106-08-02-XG196 TaxID=2737049 RepID=UPI0015C4C9CB|nr:zinc ABC transporter substrate-binding protein [Bacillus sp. EB106-08-02-XG196]NWQ39428.1 zinc ABC transporter substrate-binding protein [Bacillus sp. EB106-08-02-XG196]